MKSTQEIARELTELLREKKFIEAQQSLFAQEAVSKEPPNHEERSAHGLDQIIAKEKQFLKFIKEWNQFELSEPLISGDFFSLQMITDVLLLNNDRIKIDELIVYQVKDGKIISEQFFYN